MGVDPSQLLLRKSSTVERLAASCRQKGISRRHLSRQRRPQAVNMTEAGLARLSTHAEAGLDHFC